MDDAQNASKTVDFRVVGETRDITIPKVSSNFGKGNCMHNISSIRKQFHTIPSEDLNDSLDRLE